MFEFVKPLVFVSRPAKVNAVTYDFSKKSNSNPHLPDDDPNLIASATAMFTGLGLIVMAFAFSSNDNLQLLTATTTSSALGSVFVSGLFYLRYLRRNR